MNKAVDKLESVKATFFAAPLTDQLFVFAFTVTVYTICVQGLIELKQTLIDVDQYGDIQASELSLAIQDVQSALNS